MRDYTENFTNYLQYNHSPACLTSEQIKYIKDNSFHLFEEKAITLDNITYIYDRMEGYMLNFKELRLYDLASFVASIVRKLKPHIDYDTLALIKLRKEYQERVWKEKREKLAANV